MEKLIGSTYTLKCIIIAAFFLLFQTKTIGQCDVIVTDFTQFCNNNNTPLDPTDDYFSIMINATNPMPGVSNQYEIDVGGTIFGPSIYGNSIVIGDALSPPFITDGVTTYTVIIYDIDDNTCNEMITTLTVEECSDECLLDIFIDPAVDIICNNKGTTSDPSDDFFDLIFNVNIINGGPTFQYTVFDGSNNYTFNYGIDNMLSGYPANSIPTSFTFTDVDNPTCPVIANVSSDHCSRCEVIVPTAIIYDCNDNGTPDNSNDDWFSVTLTAVNPFPNMSSQYEVYLGGMLVGTANYGSPVTIGAGAPHPFSADGSTSYKINIQDLDDPDCGILITLDPVASCSNCDAGIIGVCATAPILCSLDELIGFTCRNPDETQTTNTSPTPICPGTLTSVQNPSWFAFVAGSESISLTVQISNCEDGNGVQMAMYENCSSYTLVPGTCYATFPQQGTTVFSSNSFIPGNIYYVLIDGWSGDECDYTILDIQGGGSFDLGNIDQLDGQLLSNLDTMCVNVSSTFSIVDNGSHILNGDEYSWSVIPASGPSLQFQTPGPTIDLTLAEVGAYTLCVNASQTQCDQISNTFCENIYVQEPEEQMLGPFIVCQDDLVAGVSPPGWEGPPIITSTPLPARHTVTLANGCFYDQVAELDLIYSPPRETVDTAFCGPANADYEDWTFSSEVINQPFSIVDAASNGCDSLINLNLSILYANVMLSASPCENGEIEVKWTPVQVTPTVIEKFTIIWTNEMGEELVDLDTDNSTISVSESGEIFLEVILEKFNVECSFSFSIDVDIEAYLPEAPQTLNWNLAPCQDAITVYEIEVPADIDSTNWSLPPGAMIIDQNSSTATIDWSGASEGELCVRFINPCGEGTQRCRTITFSPDPIANFSVVETVCLDSTVIISYTGEGTTNAMYSWDFGGGMENSSADLSGQGPFFVSWDTEGEKIIRVSHDENGCTSEVYTDTLNVLIPPSTPQVFCNSTTDELIFSWQAPSDIDSLEVILIDGVPGIQTDTNYIVPGLIAGDSVSIQLLLYPSNGCSPIASDTIKCYSENCPPVTVQFINTPAKVCLDAISSAFELEVEIIPPGSGSLTFFGTGITDAMLGTFDPTVAGFGFHNIQVNYEDGNCSYPANVDIHVLEQPVAEFTLSTDTICITDTLTVTYLGTFVGGTFLWDFDSSIFSNGMNEGPIQLLWDTQGLKTIQLQVDNMGCLSEFYQLDVEIIEELEPLNLSCGTQTTNTVEIIWDQLDELYEVWVEGISQGIQPDSSFVVEDLMPGDTVNFVVQTVSDNICGNVRDSLYCIVANCPPATVEFSIPDTSICLTPLSESINIDSIIMGGNGMGMGLGIWSGPGIDMNSGEFNPHFADIGVNTILLDYSEGNCEYSGVIEIEVIETPIADFIVSRDSLCITDTIIIEYSGLIDADDYNWDFDGANYINGSAQGPFEIHWTTGGSKSISLVVNNGGCVSDTMRMTVELIDKLEDLELACGVSTTNSVDFIWNQIDVNYEVFIDDQSQGIQSDSIFSVNSLIPGDTIDVRIETISNNICGELIETISCIVEDCPPLAIEFTIPDTSICLSASSLPINIDSIIIGGNGMGDGVGVWSGPGIDMETGVFDPYLAQIGINILAFDYIEGNCSTSAQLSIEVIEEPLAHFNISADTLCISDTILVSFFGNDVGAMLDWDFDGGNIASSTDLESYAIYFTTPGEKNIALNINNMGCKASEQIHSVFVEPEVAPLNLICSQQTSSSVSFDWDNLSNVNSYEIILDGMSVGTQDSSHINIDNLDPDTEVNIKVIALSSTQCPNISDSLNCLSINCPDIEILLSIGDTILCANEALSLIDIDAQLSIGSATGIETWSGTGITDTNLGLFDPMSAGIGMHTISYTYAEGNCTYFDFVTIDILQNPESSFTIDPSICVTDSATINFTGMADLNAVLDWSLDGGNISGMLPGPFKVWWSAPGDYQVSLRIEEPNCSSNSFQEIIEVQPELEELVISCVQTTTSIEFSWNQVSCTSLFEVFINGISQGLQSDTLFLASGLLPEQQVDIELIAISECDCPDVTASDFCVASPCPMITLEIEPIDIICLETGTNPIQLNVTLSGSSGMGNGIWSGPGVNETGLFDPHIVGESIQTIFYQFEEDFCTFVDSIDIEILIEPLAQFTVDQEICVTDTAIIVFTGIADPGDIFNWALVGGNISGNYPGPFKAWWDSPGNYGIALYVDDGICVSDVFIQNIEVQAELVPPSFTCSTTTTSVNFDWSEESCISQYEVFIDGQTQGIQSHSDFLVENLDPEQQVNIDIIAISDCECPNVSISESCSADACPIISLLIDPVSVICLNSNSPTVQLEVSVNGSDGSGNGSWSGPGVSNSGLFNPSVAGESTHRIYYTFDELACQYVSSIEIEVVEEPIAQFIIDQSICVTDTATIEFVGIANPGDHLNWSLDGGNITGTLPGPFKVWWEMAGTYQVSLSILDGECLSNSFESSIEVQPTLELPEVNCSASTSSISFNWNTVTCGEEFEVFINGNSQGMQQNTEFVLSNLDPGEQVEFGLEVISSCQCSNLVLSEICFTEPCPNVQIVINEPPEFCIGNGPGSAQLEAAISGGSGSGTGAWNGVGINSAGLFDAQLAGVGAHIVTYQYTEDNCSYGRSTEVFVYENPGAEIQINQPSCYIENIGSATVIPTNGKAPYTLFVDGSPQSNFDLFNLGVDTYDFKIVDANNCEFEGSFDIEEAEIPELSLNAPRTIRQGNIISISPDFSFGNQQIDSITWTADGLIICEGDACIFELADAPNDTTQYCATIFYDEACEITSCTVVDVIRLAQFFVPNIINPSNGSINNYFTVYSNEIVLNIISMRIFDRWGNLVFENSNFPTNQEELGWDGSYNGKKLTPGVYIYFVELEILNGEPEIISGDLTLIR